MKSALNNFPKWVTSIDKDIYMISSIADCYHDRSLKRLGTFDGSLLFVRKVYYLVLKIFLSLRRSCIVVYLRWRGRGVLFQEIFFPTTICSMVICPFMLLANTIQYFICSRTHLSLFQTIFIPNLICSDKFLLRIIFSKSEIKYIYWIDCHLK